MVSSEPGNVHERFPITRWSLVVHAGDGSDAESEKALEELCQLYWRPLYSFIRSYGHSREDAEDYTQEFLSGVIAKDYLKRADKERGKLRSFLLTYLKYFLCDKHKGATRQKRGGGKPVVSIDGAAAEAFTPALVDAVTPEVQFERAWALTLLEHVLTKLQTLYEDEGKAALFTALKPSMAWSGAGEENFADIAQRLGMTAGAVKVAAFRLRKRYRTLLRREIARTLADGENVEDEMRHLFEILRGWA